MALLGPELAIARPDRAQAYLLRLMVRSRAKRGVSNHEAVPSFETLFERSSG